MHVVIVGSGAAGLSAALGAAANGAQVTVVEAAPRLGGTTALSAGAAWIPANRRMVAAGIPDSPDRALTYLRTFQEIGYQDDDLLKIFCHDASRVAEALEKSSPLRWQMQDHPDYYERDGACSAGRTLEPAPLMLTPEVAAVEQLVHRGQDGDLGTVPITFGDTLQGRGSFAIPDNMSVVTMGRGLVVALAAGAKAAGCSIVTGSRADRLIADESGAVRGISVGSDEHVGSVVLATGGFERSAELTSRFLPGPRPLALGAATSLGDGLRMAMTIGAELANCAEAWWCPAYRIPGETVDGTLPRSRIVFPSHRAAPGSVVIDRSGHRFLNEATNYNDFGRAMTHLRGGWHDFDRSPAWLVFDSGFRQRHATFLPPDHDPPWCFRSDSVQGLAQSIGVPHEHLERTVLRFNEMVKEGYDSDFGRGTFAYDRFHGEEGRTLGTLTRAPFYALEIHAGAIGTKGGPRTDVWGRVIRSGTPVPGLYAAGNIAASPFGTVYAGGGATLGPALVFGHRAGEAAALEQAS